MAKTFKIGSASTADVLHGSISAVRNAFQSGAPVTKNDILIRLQEWQDLAKELASGMTQGAELATLYEVTQVLNSSLDLDETLDLVMESLIRLTGAERGCLMLHDDQGKLDIHAMRNFQQDTIEPKDLELSHTVVEKVTENGIPVVTTNAQLDPRFSSQESVIGYHLRSIVCIPLHVRGKIIGALYMDSRLKSGVFSEKDIPMLMAFANQAAVAIENARLYTLTDLALAARVEELTTLQQLDRELNASLDIEHVLELTLSWAMRATGAKRGTLSIVGEEQALIPMASAGRKITKKINPELVERVVDSRVPIVTGGYRMLIPIYHEERLIGLLDLQRETDNGAFRSDHIQLASRLADHAAISIQNAHLYQQVHNANRAKSEFVSFVAHELRTPMTSIRGYAEMLGKGMIGELNEQQADFVDTISSNVERMQILVSDLQDVARIETDQMRLEPKMINLNDSLESALKSTQGQMESREQTLTVDVPQDLPDVKADPARVTQILINLLSNACKYTPEGGHIEVKAWPNGNFIYCAVADDGFGISEEDQAKLFTKFFRSENPDVRNMPGTGLGLCITKNLIELQGGEIILESEIGKGTTFTFTVPLIDAASAQ